MDTVTNENIKAGLVLFSATTGIYTGLRNHCEFSCATKMNRVRRHSRAASDFSIARILADEDRTEKSLASSLSATVRTCSDGPADISRRESAVATIANANTLGTSRLVGEFSVLPSFETSVGGGTFDCLDTPNASGFHGSRTIATQAESSQLARGAGDRENSKIERGELSWLQCTRYRPPKLPRKTVAGKSGKRRPGAHPRIPFTASQLRVLEDKYRNTAYLSRREVIQLSTLLRLPQSRVKIWFQNRRARDRRETSASASSVTILSADAPSNYKTHDIPRDNPTAPSPVRTT